MIWGPLNGSPPSLSIRAWPSEFYPSNQLAIIRLKVHRELGFLLGRCPSSFAVSCYDFAIAMLGDQIGECDCLDQRFQFVRGNTLPCSTGSFSSVVVFHLFGIFAAISKLLTKTFGQILPQFELLDLAILPRPCEFHPGLFAGIPSQFYGQTLSLWKRRGNIPPPISRQ
jgi:hypothetical protein